MDAGTLFKPRQVYKIDLVQRLLQAVFSGQFRGGDRLVEAELARRFGVSRTPIREALMELSGVGLVLLKPNCGAVLEPFGPDQVREIYQVREVLEAEAARLAGPRLKEEWIVGLMEAFEGLLAEGNREEEDWSQRAWAFDRELHAHLAEQCGNRRLAEEIRRYGSFIQVVRETVGNRDRAQDAAMREHLEILSALKENQFDLAANRMREHIRIAGEAAQEAVRPNFGAHQQP